VICAKCKRRLRADATNCICGWSSNSSRNEIIPCAYAPCSAPAICRIFVRGWINVCFDHYTSADFKRPVANSPVIEEWRKWKAERSEREPGQDDERAA
jgi:hypothetical protein